MARNRKLNKIKNIQMRRRLSNMGIGFPEDFEQKEEKEFWHHVCPVQGGRIGFEKGAECDWCGRSEDDDTV